MNRPATTHTAKHWRFEHRVDLILAWLAAGGAAWCAYRAWWCHSLHQSALMQAVTLSASDPHSSAILNMLPVLQHVERGFWVGVILSAVFWLVAAWLVARARRAKRSLRSALGCCAACGYSLTGLIEPRCPECGMTFDQSRIDRAGGTG